MISSRKSGQKQRDKIRQTLIAKLSKRDKIVLLLKYGILAPSTHNTQPWKFSIEENILKIFIDFDKEIPVADPIGRDMYISIGALIKNIELAGKEYGVKANIVFSKNLKNKELVAEIHFSNLDKAKNPKESEVLEGILKRQNYRGFFEESFDMGAFKTVINKTIGSNKAVKATFTDKKNTIEKLAQLTVKGLRAAYAMPEFRQEIGSLINHNLSRKRHGLHGHSLRMNIPQSFVIPKVVKRKDIGAKLGALNYKSFMTSPVVIVISTKNDDPSSWLSAGQAMEEFMVIAASSGMATSIYTAAIEMPGLRDEVSRTMNMENGENPQILFCIGKPGKPLPYSVRRNIAKVLT